jgi:hypothetical protein
MPELYILTTCPGPNKDLFIYSLTFLPDPNPKNKFLDTDADSDPHTEFNKN